MRWFDLMLIINKHQNNYFSSSQTITLFDEECWMLDPTERYYWIQQNVVFGHKNNNYNQTKLILFFL